ncbi:hypothetical protein LY11_03399 [Pedobacter cryoconitis]|uniref:CRP-like cAMP-binding protein n=2 Tax=Pedobacter cryoconitis TaxID=188932 RepID=A0A327SG60_9SPHI|nr:hypothetical protein LY11_03399 [Pedobacter cryoconitis]
MLIVGFINLPIDMEALIKKLESFNTATKDSVEMLKNLFVKTEFKKGWVLGDSPWQQTPTLFYISEGLLRGTVEYGETVYTMWLMESGFLIPGNRFLSKRNGITEIVEFLSDTKAYALNLYRADNLAKDNVSLYKMLLEIYEENLIDGRKRELMLRMDTATERINYYKKTNPSIIYKTDKNIFAPYVRMSVRHLDRFKGAK